MPSSWLPTQSTSRGSENHISLPHLSKLYYVQWLVSTVLYTLFPTQLYCFIGPPVCINLPFYFQFFIRKANMFALWSSAVRSLAVWDGSESSATQRKPEARKMLNPSRCKKKAVRHCRSWSTRKRCSKKVSNRRTGVLFMQSSGLALLSAGLTSAAWR